MKTKAKTKAKKVDCARLCAAVQSSYQKLQVVREKRVEYIREYVGAHYSDNANDVANPVNLIASFVEIVGRRLISNNPRVMYSTKLKNAKATVKTMEAWVNVELRRQNVCETFSRAVMNALYDFGVVKVALATPSDAANKGWNLKAGTPLISVIDLDDYVVDMNAKRWDEVRFEGHRYRVPLDTIMDSDLYSPARKDMAASRYSTTNAGGDERAQTIGGSDGVWQEEFEDMVDLWEIYLPAHGLVYTFLDDGAGLPTESEHAGETKPLRVQKWIGPESGPYYHLGFGTVPGNLRPKGMICDLIDLHRAENNVQRKLIRQSARYKKFTAYGKNNVSDANSIREVMDGGIVGLDNPGQVGEVVQGGPDQGLQAISSTFVSLFDKQAGNLGIIGGTAPQSPTAKQDQMLNTNASVRITDMQATVVQFVAMVLRGQAWFYHHDPFKLMEATYSLPGLPDISIERRASPEDRKKIPWEKMDITVDPYSLPNQTPEQKASNLTVLMTNTLIPALPLIKESGATLDIQRYLQILAELTNMEEIKEIVTISTPPEMGAGGPGQSEGSGVPGSPANSTRTYERVSRPAGTDGAEQNAVQQMMKQAEASRG